ncbi:retropepsin-like domain-containing protein [Streptomyces sp. ISL-10]|uniref:retropepsin-like aspartic protease n=1 Tax=Streptomyces sp. ISL-10 TaxID=2819172 RepID=UPI001BE82965|nr:retropepsin-like aspartic protease [Streptomyces sp. ISL-10]MBT2367271.1 retropepsin-like domain-containing protein [Streptomyces sp. ISL-10]
MSMRDDGAPGMRHQWASRLVGGPLAALLLVSCIAYEDRDDRDGPQMSPEAVREVPLRVVEQGGQSLAFVPVTVEGEGPFMFALDTGASTSVVDEDVADQVGLERTGERRSVSGILGTGQVPVARVDQWKVGDVRIEPGEVTVIDLGPPQGGSGLQGLLGSDVLSDFGSITVDYDDGVLKIPAP